ncbi:MAG TPA: DUF6585 family protein [Myxococcales bacterium]|jgi:hypothetical protein|nr:DUF6585 family protein [Myxococcales bacterium]
MELLLPPEDQVTATHPATWTGRVMAVLAFVVLGAAIVAAGYLGTDANARIPMMACGIAGVCLGLLIVVQQNRSKVVVRADGIERWGLRGKLWALRWADMAEMRYRAVKLRVYGVIPAGTTIHIQLTDPAGKKHKVPSNVKHMDVLAERIADQQTGARFPEARAQLDRGEEVRFGKALMVDREKISARKFFGGYKTCPLAEVEKVSVEGGYVKIRQRGKMLSFGGGAVGAIPNVFLLLRLLDSLVQRPSAIPQERDFSARQHVG